MVNFHIENFAGCFCSLRSMLHTTLLEPKKPSKIPFILFTVNYCNIHCIVDNFNEMYSNLLYMDICSILLFTQKQ